MMACEQDAVATGASDVALGKALFDAPGSHSACSLAFSPWKLTLTQSGDRGSLTESRRHSILMA